MVGSEGALPPGTTLPDADDVHVLAAAVEAGATSIVTFNLRDFPVGVLAPLGVGALHPDDFVLARIDEAPGLVCAVIEGQARALHNPPATARELVSRLSIQGLPRSAARLADLLGESA